MNKKIGLGAGLLMLIACFLPLLGAGEGDQAMSVSMWDLASGYEEGDEKKDGQALHYLYLVLAAGALFFTWTDNYKFAKIAFSAVILFFVIQYFTGVTPEDQTKDQHATVINSDMFGEDSFLKVKMGLWLLLGSSVLGAVFSKE